MLTRYPTIPEATAASAVAIKTRLFLANHEGFASGAGAAMGAGEASTVTSSSSTSSRGSSRSIRTFMKAGPIGSSSSGGSHGAS